MEPGGEKVSGTEKIRQAHNEIDTNDDHSDGPGASITAVVGANWADPKYDAAGNVTLVSQVVRGGSAGKSDAVKYDAWNLFSLLFSLDQ